MLTPVLVFIAIIFPVLYFTLTKKPEPMVFSVLSIAACVGIVIFGLLCSSMLSATPSALFDLASNGGSVFEQLLTGTTRAPGLEESLTDTMRAMGHRNLIPVPGAQEDFEQLVAVIRRGKLQTGMPPKPFFGTPGRNRFGAELAFCFLGLFISFSLFIGSEIARRLKHKEAITT